jgi:hypothetical protein
MRKCDGLTEIILPNSIKKIFNYFMRDCENL